MATNRLDKIAELNEEIAQIKKRQALLRQQHNKQERKERTHRLCKRGGLVEKHLPGLTLLNDEQFNIFVEKTLFSGYAGKILKGLLPPSEPGTEPEGASNAEHISVPSDSAKSTDVASAVS